MLILDHFKVNSMEILKQVLLSHIPSNSRSSGKCISFNCPCCVYMGEPRPDSKGRGGLFIEHDTVGYNCFNCRFKFRHSAGSELGFKVRKFMELLGVPKSEINKAQLEGLKSSNSTFNLLGINYQKQEKPKIDLNFQRVELPRGTHLIHDVIRDAEPGSDVFDVYNYAIERGVGSHPYIMWSEDRGHRFHRRLIIPFMYDGDIVGYTARLVDPCAKKDRYVTHSPNSGKYVFNLDALFKKRKYVFINESPIDAIIYDGVATMNFEPSYKQVQLINNFPGKKIVIPDFGSGGKRMVDTAIKNDWGVFFPDWNKGFDLGQASQMYGRLFVAQHIIRNYISNPVTIKIKKNLY